MIVRAGRKILLSLPRRSASSGNCRLKIRGAFFSRVGLFVSVVAGNFYVVFVWTNLRLECRDFSSSEGLFISDNTGVMRWLSVDVCGKFARKTLQNLTGLIVCTLRDGAK